jgi:hypothetical protein
VPLHSVVLVAQQAQAGQDSLSNKAEKIGGPDGRQGEIAFRARSRIIGQLPLGEYSVLNISNLPKGQIASSHIIIARSRDTHLVQPLSQVGHCSDSV